MGVFLQLDRNRDLNNCHALVLQLKKQKLLNFVTFKEDQDCRGSEVWTLNNVGTTGTQSVYHTMVGTTQLVNRYYQFRNENNGN